MQNKATVIEKNVFLFICLFEWTPAEKISALRFLHTIQKYYLQLDLFTNQSLGSQFLFNEN